MSKKLGVIPYLFAQPLFQGLKNNPSFTLTEDTFTQLAIKLRQKEIDGAFLSPIDYAKDYAMYRIIPKVAAISEGESNSILLFFKQNTRDIQTISVDLNSSSEIVLASIILAEKYDHKVKFVPFSGTIDQALNKTDAYLGVNDNAFQLKHMTNKIDLVDEWKDITELPFVHGFWVSRENEFTSEEMKQIIESGEIANTEQKDSFQFRFELIENDITAINEFFRMAYYHGILQDIPDVKFFNL